VSPTTHSRARPAARNPGRMISIVPKWPGSIDFLWYCSVRTARLSLKKQRKTATISRTAWHYRARWKLNWLRSKAALLPQPKSRAKSPSRSPVSAIQCRQGCLRYGNPQSEHDYENAQEKIYAKRTEPSTEESNIQGEVFRERRGVHGVAVGPFVGFSLLAGRRTTLCPDARWMDRRSSQIAARSALNFRVCSIRYLRTCSTIGSFMPLTPEARRASIFPDMGIPPLQPFP